MSTCSTCKYWNSDFATYTLAEDNLTLQQCARVKLLWDATTWDEHGEARILTDECANDKAFVVDASDYRAELLTKSTFGCNQYEKRT